MTIRRRLALSFLAILLLFGLNVVVYFWSSQQQGSAFEGLRRAMSRQILVLSIDQNLANGLKQVDLQSQIAVDHPETGVGREEKAQFHAQLAKITKQISDLAALSDPIAVGEVEQFGKTYGDLRISWKIFYENFGVDHGKAITELALRGEPLGRMLMEELSALKAREENFAETARFEFYETTEVTNRMTLAIFIFSILVAMTVAYLFSRYLVLGLNRLKDGAGRIGSGNLDYHIAIVSHDEMGELAQAFNRMTDELRSAHLQITRVNKELEAFSYSVSHDLRAPLRRIDGFSQALIEDYSERLNAEGKDYLNRVRNSAHDMANLVDDLLTLSRVTRGALKRGRVPMSELAHAIASDLNMSCPEREVDWTIEEGLVADGDERLIQALLTNLLGNAWKYSEKQGQAKIEFGITHVGEKPAFFVRDNGAGFSMEFSDKLFVPFQRLHTEEEFEGTGIGLATVQRIVNRHGGSIWAEAAVGKGATFYFTL